MLWDIIWESIYLLGRIFCCCCCICFFLFYFIFKLYIIVLVLPNIKMNPPQIYMCSPSWTLIPPPSPFHPSGSSVGFLKRLSAQSIPGPHTEMNSMISESCCFKGQSWVNFLRTFRISPANIGAKYPTRLKWPASFLKPVMEVLIKERNQGS